MFSMFSKHVKGYRDAALLVAAALAIGAGYDVLRAADWSAIMDTANEVITEGDQWQPLAP
jgi:hypothetical protein